MKKPYSNSWIFVFIFAFSIGLIVRDMHTSKFAVIKGSSALAPTPSLEELYDEDEESKDELININTADREQLMQLEGIGEKMAQRIIEYRAENGPFETIQDIMKVSGIGEKKFANMRDFITVD